MKINNLGVASTSLPSPKQVEDAGAAGGGAPVQGTAVAARGYAPSPELLQLVDLLRRQPDVRVARVQAATQRLEQGHYHTPTAAANTAAALLAARD